jgi:alpha-mannosidase
VKKNIHLLCNAHLDPVWVWEWQEGAAEAISTFRTAAGLCEKNENFVFNHNEVVLYEWVRQYEPKLFQRIQKLVREGKWHIMGGWYLQPDCNMPSGESFIRQILYGKTYFKKYFGADITTAINFDPFGSSRGLVQILKKSGYDSYLFGRPDQDDCPLPSDEFIWVGYDNSRILATRVTEGYNSPPGKAREKIENWIREYGDKKCSLILWGVGNHGGGPSKKDVNDITKLIAKVKDCNIIHSTPEAYFRELKQLAKELPEYHKGLNPWGVGCYTTQIRIKQKHRQLENEVYSLEKMATAAYAQKLIEYPQKEIEECLTALMFGQFHDILPGSSNQSAEEASLRLFDYGLEIASRVKTRAFFSLCGGQPSAQKGTIPILVYNHHPYSVKQIVECEFNLPEANFPEQSFDDATFTPVEVFKDKQRLPSQLEHEESNLGFDWRKKIVFYANLNPGQNRFDCHLKGTQSKKVMKTGPNKIIFKTPRVYIVINTKTGLLDKYRVNGVDYLKKGAFAPIVMNDIPDSWVMNDRRFRNLQGKFKLMNKKQGSLFSGIKDAIVDSVRIIEEGDVRCVIEAVFSYQNSFISQQYKLSKVSTEIEVETRVYWLEKDSMLKISIPDFCGDKAEYLGQTAYGIDQLPANGDEAVAQKWTAVVDRQKNMGITCINNGIYGSDFSSDGLRLSLLRSPAYSCAPWLFDYGWRNNIAKNRFIPRVDQGERVFRFWLNAGTVSERLNSIERESLVKNEVPFALSFFPQSGGIKPKLLVILNDDVIQVTAVKKAEKGSAIIIRLFEPTGRKRKTILTLPFIDKKLKLSLNAFEIKTFKINLKTKNVKEVNLLEQSSV